MHVRFGSKADICAATSHVRFTPNSDRESEIPQKAMSALPPKADMCGAIAYVCYGPKADIALFDHLVSELLEMHRHVEAQRFGCLEVDDKLIFRRRLHGHVGWLLPLENTVDVAGGAPVHFDPIGGIREQAASGDESAIVVDRGQFVLRRKRDDQIPINQGWPARGHDQPAIREPREGRDGALDLASVAFVERADLHPERGRHSLNNPELGGAGGYVGIAKDRDALHAGRDLLQQLQPFSADAIFEKHEPGGVAARPRQALDETAGDWIGNDREHDRYGAGHLQQRPYGRRARCQNDVRRERGQLCRIFANPGDTAWTPSDVKPYVAAINPTELLQCLPECADPRLIARIVRGCIQEHGDTPNALGLLSAGRKRKRCR